MLINTLYAPPLVRDFIPTSFTKNSGLNRHPRTPSSRAGAPAYLLALAAVAALLAVPATAAWGIDSPADCGPGLEPIMKQRDGSLACVMSASVQPLIERGWGSTLPADYMPDTMPPADPAMDSMAGDMMPGTMQEPPADPAMDSMAGDMMHGTMDMSASAGADASVTEVRDAIAEYEQSGMDALQAITDSAASYDPSIPYVFVLDSANQPTVLAHGAFAERVGIMPPSVTHADRPYGEILADLRAAGDTGTWIEYTFVNPATGTDQHKRSFMVMHDGHIFGAGYYDDSIEPGVMGFPVPVLDLTDEERAWLDANPQIMVSYDPDWEPYEYVDESGMLSGLVAYYIPIFDRMTGAEFVPAMSETWTDALDSIKDGSSHVILTVGISDERGTYMDFTEPHTYLAWNMVTLDEDTVIPDSLEGLNVGTIRNYAIEEWLDAERPDVAYTGYESQTLAMEALSSGEIDVLLQVWGVALSSADYADNLHNAGSLGDKLELAVGYSKDQQTLGSIMQKAVAAIPHEARHAIAAQAVFDSRLTDAERMWMAENPVIKVGYDPDAPPYEYAGGPDGIAGLTPSYIRIFETVTGAGFAPVHSSSWDAALEAAKAGDIDILTVIAETEQRKEHFGFTEPHTTMEWNIVTAGTGPESVSPDELAGLKVGTIRGYAIEDWMRSNMPAVSFIPHDNHATALSALSSGQIDVLLDTFEVVQAAAMMNDMDADLQNAGTVGDPLELAVAYPVDEPELGSILQKALDTVPEGKRLMIEAKAVFYNSLTEPEMEWMAGEPTVRVAYDQGWPPYEYRDADGMPAGFPYYYMYVMEKLTGADFEPVHTDTWTEALEGLRTGTADMAFSIENTPERSEYLGFTEPYIMIPNSIVTTTQTQVDQDMLSSMQVGVIEAYSISAWLDEQGIQHTTYPDHAAALEALKSKQIEAFVDSWEVTSASAEMAGVTVYNAGTLNDVALSAGYDADQPILGSLLQKAFDALPQAKHDMIYDKVTGN